MCEQRKSNEFYEKASQKVDEVKRDAEDMIRKHPLTSVAVAAGVGAVTGIAIFSGIRMLTKRYH